MGQIAKPIVESLKFSDFIVNTVTGDLDDTIARRQARVSEGASIAWVIGHLLHHRHQMLALLGEEADDPFAERFGSTAASGGEDYPPFNELVRAWNETSAKLLPVVTAASDDVLTRHMEGGGPHGEKQVLDTMVFHMWHEAYHIGQIGTLRTQFGLPATAALATAEAGS